MEPMKTDAEIPVSGQLLNGSTVRGVMVEAGATVRQVNGSLEHWPEDGNPDGIALCMTATGLRRLQIKVIIHTLREVASILDIGTRNGNQSTADRNWTAVLQGQPADKDPATMPYAEPGSA